MALGRRLEEIAADLRAPVNNAGMVQNLWGLSHHVRESRKQACCLRLLGKGPHPFVRCSDEAPSRPEGSLWRSLYEIPSGLTTRLEAFRPASTAKRRGHESGDFMRRAGGELIAIELHSRGVGGGWASQLPPSREHYTDGLYELVPQNRSPRPY